VSYLTFFVILSNI